MNRCREGDECAWRALLERYERPVLATALRHGLSRDHAGDVLQETFLQLVRSLADIDDADRIGAWLLTTATRASLRHLRRQKLYVERAGAPIGEADPFDPATVAAAETELAAALSVREALERLGGRCRELLGRLYGEAPQSYESIAKVLGMPIGSIGPTRARCLEKLRDLLGR